MKRVSEENKNTLRREWEYEENNQRRFEEEDTKKSEENCDKIGKHLYCARMKKARKGQEDQKKKKNGWKITFNNQKK